MKRINILIISLISLVICRAQNISERVTFIACDCLDSIETYQQLEDSINSCISKAMVDVMNECKSDEKKEFSTVEGMTGIANNVNEMLPSYCYNVRRLMIKEKEKNYYKLSDDPSANEYYAKGNELMNAGDYENSIKEFKKAIAIDKNFIYAYDHLAISYRRNEEYKKAIKYYQNSLDIYPEGSVAILNIAVAYSFIKDYNNSLKYYNSLKFLYQDDPEGYFGAAKILFIKSEYEDALENIFKAYHMYLDSNSEYIKDCEGLIGMMYSELKKIDKLDIFMEKAKKFNINININE